jgi:hypothetical protein
MLTRKSSSAEDCKPLQTPRQHKDNRQVVLWFELAAIATQPHAELKQKSKCML